MITFTRIACAIILAISMTFFISPVCSANDKFDSSANIPSSAYGVVPTTVVRSNSTVAQNSFVSPVNSTNNLNKLGEPITSTTITAVTTTHRSSPVESTTVSPSFVPPAVVIPPGPPTKAGADDADYTGAAGNVPSNADFNNRSKPSVPCTGAAGNVPSNADSNNRSKPSGPRVLMWHGAPFPPNDNSTLTMPPTTPDDSTPSAPFMPPAVVAPPGPPTTADADNADYTGGLAYQRGE